MAGAPAEYGDPLGEAHARDCAVRDFKSHLKTVGGAKPSSVNLSLAAIDNFYKYLGLRKPDVRREEPPKSAPRALSPGEQKRFYHAGSMLTAADWRALSHLYWSHVNPYGTFRLDMARRLDLDHGSQDANGHDPAL